MLSLRGYVSGRVQGVGFRYYVRRAAEAEGVRGYAINLADGRVEFLLQGQREAVHRVIGLIREGPRHARVDEVELHAADDIAARPDFHTG